MFEQIINSKFQLIQTDFLTNLSLFFGIIGDKFTIIFLSLILIFLLSQKRDFIKIKIYSFVLILGLISTKILKELIQRPRPDSSLILKTGYSFPSGHAVLATIFFGMIIYLFYKEIKGIKLKITFISINLIFILLISISRLYLNVHYFTDIVAGILLGFICIYIGHLTKNKFSWFKKIN